MLFLIHIVFIKISFSNLGINFMTANQNSSKCSSPFAPFDYNDYLSIFISNIVLKVSLLF